MKYHATTINQYWHENRKWCMPLAGTVILLASSLILSLFNDLGVPLQLSLPSWAMNLGFILGGLLTGFGAQQTDTLSALFVRYIAFSVTVLMAVWMGLQLSGYVAQATSV